MATTITLTDETVTVDGVSYDKRVTDVPVSPPIEPSPPAEPEPQTGSFAPEVESPAEDAGEQSEEGNSSEGTQTSAPVVPADTTPAPAADTAPAEAGAPTPSVDPTSADYLAGESAQKAADDTAEAVEDEAEAAVRAANAAASSETPVSGA